MLFLHIGVLLCLATLSTDALALPGLSIMCYQCENVRDPADCTVLHKCHRGEHACYSEVTVLNGVPHLTRGCKHEDECRNTLLSVIGKRKLGHEHGTVLCRDCCTTIGCNKDTCDQSIMPTTTAVPTTTASSAACRDHESDGFMCADYDYTNFCTDTTGLAHKLAHDRCPAHCGFCDNIGNYMRPCRDHEEGGFMCADYDTTSFCTDTSSIAHKLALERCPDHCGFCDADGYFKPGVINGQMTTMPATMMPTTEMPTTMMPSTGMPTTMMPTMTMPNMTMPSTASPILMASVVVNPDATGAPAQTTQTGSTCADYEDADFSCVQWASYGFCLNVSGTGHDIAVTRCSKYCGFCT